MTSKERKAYKEALKNYGHCCAISGHTTVHIHHIVYRSHSGATVKENLIPLSPKWHNIVHTNEHYWVDYLLDLNRGKYGIINKEDLKIKGKYSDFKFGN